VAAVGGVYASEVSSDVVARAPFGGGFRVAISELERAGLHRGVSSGIYAAGPSYIGGLGVKLTPNIPTSGSWPGQSRHIGRRRGDKEHTSRESAMACGRSQIVWMGRVVLVVRFTGQPAIARARSADMQA
jgi:hypothetical protein